MKHIATCCFIFILCGCSGQGRYQDYLKFYGIDEPEINNFTHCFNYGCQTQAKVALPAATEKKLKKLFSPAPKSAKSERLKIAQAIGIFETDIGAMTGTANDYHGTFRLYQTDAPSTRNFQQDCVDESTNTTIYLSLLNQMGFLKFHNVGFPATRQPFSNGNRWWHQTATIQETSSSAIYVVDSWFFDNGAPAVVIPLNEWKKGWHPAKS